MTPQELLNANDIYLENYDLGNHTSICPQCSHARKPAHQKTECVSVKIDDKGPTWYCHHCGYSGPPKGGGKSNGQGGEFAATYDYPGFQKVRYPKGHEPRFRIRHREGNGWRWGAGRADTRVLYRKDEVDKAIVLGRTILVVEGEKDVDRCWSVGIPATCNAHGAAEPGKKPKWRAEHSAQLRGADIVVIPDHDDAGYAHCDATCRASLGVAKRVRRLVLAEHWSECPKGGDISDWLDAGHGREELDTLIDEAPDYGKAESEKKGAKSERHADEIMRLAKLTTVEYEHQRKGAADKLDVRASILDKLVEAERLRLNPNDDGKQGHAIVFPEPEPWLEPVDGAALLDGIAEAIRNHVFMPDHCRDACALWVVHSFLTERFLVSPRLGIRSPTKACGKTLLLDVLGRLVARPLTTASVTPAAIFRVVEAHRPTLLIDEADTFLYDNDELRGVLNGNRKGSTVLRTVGDDHEPRAFSVYTAVAIALIGALPDTLHDRAVTIDLQRRRPNEMITPYRPDRADHLDTLARKAMRWAEDHADRIGEWDPAMPDGVINRMADNWRPLLAIAAAAKGEWPQRARKAAEASRGAEGDEASRLELLLADIRTIAKGKVQMASADLVKELVASEGRPWAEMGKAGKPLTQNKLARMLKPLGIVPENIYVGDEKRPKGYVFKHFEEAFTRYLPPEGASEPLNRYNADETGTSDLFQTAQPNPDVAVRKCEKSNNDGPCSGVAVAKGGSSEKTHVRTTRAKSDDLPHAGPVVDVPDQGPDGLDEHGAPQAAHNILGQWAPHGEPALSSRRIQALADWYADKAYYQYSAINAGDLDAKLRAILREEVFPEHVEIEFQRVKKAVWRGP